MKIPKQYHCHRYSCTFNKEGECRTKPRSWEKPIRGQKSTIVKCLYFVQKTIHRNSETVWVVMQIHARGLWPILNTMAWRKKNAIRKYNDKYGKTITGTQVTTYKDRKKEGHVICKKIRLMG